MKIRNCKNLLITNKRAIVLNITFAFLLFNTIYLLSQDFVEAETLPKSYAFIGGSLLCCLGVLLPIRTSKIRIDIITIPISIFIGYLLLRSFLTPHIHNNIHILSLIAFILIYFSFRLIPSDYLKYIDVLILCVCGTQACYGLMQYTGILDTYKIFRIVGSYDNPAGFAACLSAGLPFCLLAISKSSWKLYIGILTLMIFVLAIILSESRTGLIAVIIVSFLFFGSRYYNYLKNHIKHPLLTIIITLLLMGLGLFFLKKDSALGRILIWSNCIEMIKDSPIIGNGSGYFLGNYMKFQAGYFEHNTDSLSSLLSDNVIFPFNEYLLLTIEYGVVGLLLLLAIIFIIIKCSNKITISHLCLLSIGIFAFFSYPLHYPFVMVIIGYSLANIGLKDIFVLTIEPLVKIIGVVFILIIFILMIKDIQFEIQWKQLVERANWDNYDKLYDDYKKIYSKWNGNPMFLYNYGAILNKGEQYEKSNSILFECTKHFDDYDVQMIIADNYYKLKEFNKAESHYITANNMIPSRFIPLYKLMLLYDEIGNKTKSRELAYKILHKKVKISSTTVSHIQNEARKIIEDIAERELIISEL